MKSKFAAVAVLVAGVCWIASAVASARELAVDADRLVAVELASVAVDPVSGTPVVLLREPDAGGLVPIYIGPTEAQAIVMAQRGIELERPLTHDLATGIIDALDAKLERVVVDELREGTYLGALELRVGGEGRLVRVDTRPSDGLALAVRTGAAIAVAPAILSAGEDIPFHGLDSDEEVVTALGITVMAVGDDIRTALELPDEPGVIVTATRSLAALSGLRPGALIQTVDGTAVTTPMEYLEAVNAADEAVVLQYWFDGESREIELSTAADTSRRQQRRL